MQKLHCPVCDKLLIKNADLVIDDKVVFDLDKIAKTTQPTNTIFCENCKRRLKYYIGKEGKKC